MPPTGRPARAWRKRASICDRQLADQAQPRPPMPRDPLAAGLLEIEKYRRAWDTHRNIAALYEAARVAWEIHRMPRWLAEALSAWIQMSLSAPGIRRLYRRHRQDMIDYTRADLVADARAHALTWKRAYDFAADYLRPTEARGSAEAMKKSHALVQQRKKREPGRYHQTRFMMREFDELGRPPCDHVLKIMRQFPEAPQPQE